MKYFNIIIIAVLFIVLAAQEAYSIPAFARQYRLSCQTCHAPFPRLKPYGDEFAGNGFTFTDKEAPRYYVETGDSELSLLREFPIGIRFDLSASHNTAKSAKADFGTPYNLKFLSGGTITKDIAYYFYFFFSERGEVAGVEDAYVMFNNMFGIDLDLYVGQFQISDPLFKRELRLTGEDYEIYRTRVGINKANLTYDRGLMLTLGLETGTDIILELLNGNGIGAADENRLFDNDNNKNVFGRVSQEVFENLRVGAFAYIGKQGLENANLKSTAEFQIFGPDATISVGDFAELNLQYVMRTDKNTIIDDASTSPSKELKTQGAFAELLITPKGDESKQYGALLFNYIDSDLKELNKKSMTLHLGHALRRNLRFFAEYSYYSTELDGDYGKFNLGIVSGF